MSIRELEKNKKYQIEIVLGYLENKKKKRHYETFYGTKQEAYLYEAERKIQIKEGTFIQKRNITFQQFSVEYLKLQKDVLAPKTYITYEQRIKVINKYIGHMKLENINAKVLEFFYGDLRKNYISTRKNTTLSPSTIQSFYAIINNMLNTAVKWDYIKVNVNEKIKKPKRAKVEIQYYTKDEVNQLLKCLENESLKTQSLIRLALDLGCRRGELTGLTWDDVDLKTGKVTINKVTQYANKKVYEKETKTENSNRTNYISESTINVLKKYRQEELEKQMRLGPKWIPTNRVFTGRFGGDLFPDYPTRMFYDLQKKYNLKRISFHGLRHTHVSLMILQGIPLPLISRKVGHSSAQITDTIYTHVHNEEFRAIANAMQNVFVAAQ